MVTLAWRYQCQKPQSFMVEIQQLEKVFITPLSETGKESSSIFPSIRRQGYDSLPSPGIGVKQPVEYVVIHLGR